MPFDVQLLYPSWASWRHSTAVEVEVVQKDRKFRKMSVFVMGNVVLGPLYSKSISLKQIASMLGLLLNDCGIAGRYKLYVDDSTSALYLDTQSLSTNVQINLKPAIYHVERVEKCLNDINDMINSDSTTVKEDQEMRSYWMKEVAEIMEYLEKYDIHQKYRACNNDHLVVTDIQQKMEKLKSIVAILTGDGSLKASWKLKLLSVVNALTVQLHHALKSRRALLNSAVKSKHEFSANTVRMFNAHNLDLMPSNLPVQVKSLSKCVSEFRTRLADCMILLPDTNANNDKLRELIEQLLTMESHRCQGRSGTSKCHGTFVVYPLQHVRQRILLDFDLSAI